MVIHLGLPGGDVGKRRKEKTKFLNSTVVSVLNNLTGELSETDMRLVFTMKEKVTEYFVSAA